MLPILLPPYSFEDEKKEMLTLVKSTIAVKEFEVWCTNPDWWPKLGDETEFDRWFVCEVSSWVNDLVDDEINRELH